MTKELKNRVLILTEKYTKCKREKEDIEKQFNEYKSKYMSIIFENELLQKKFNTTNSSNPNMKSENENKIDDLTKKIKELVNKNIQYEQKILNLEKEKNEIKEQKEKIKEEKEKLTNENEELKEMVNNLMQENEQLDVQKRNFHQFKTIPNFFNENDFDNYIHAEYLINEDDVNEDVQLLNYEENDNDPQNPFNNPYDSPNKKEIEDSCIMFFNNKRIKFRFFFNFYKPGKYTFKFAFIKNLTNASHLFDECSNLIHIDFSHFKTDKIIDMNNMFFGCEQLQSLDLTSFNTIKVEDMSEMFSHCEQLKYINLSSFKTFNVKSTFKMFHKVPNECKVITSNRGLLKEKNKIYEDDDDDDDDDDDYYDDYDNY